MAAGYDNSNAQAHLAIYRADPAKGHLIYPKGDGKPVTTLLLTTKGRKSGAQRTTPLIYREVDGAYVIVASLAGAPTHPAWYLNLVGHPDCDIQIAHDHLRVRARVASGTERERLWRAAAEQWPDYDDYQARTERQIPVVVLEPVRT